MSVSRSEKLLRELLVLYAKYGEQDFRQAILMLESGDLVASFADVARLRPKIVGQRAVQSKKGASDKYKKPSRTSRDRFEEYLNSIKGDDGGKDVYSFISELYSGEYLPNGRILSEFASQIGISTPSKLDKYNLLQKISDRLLSMSNKDRRQYIENAARMDSHRSSLGEWSKIIVKDLK